MILKVRNRAKLHNESTIFIHNANYNDVPCLFHHKKNKFVAQVVRIFESHDIYSDSLTLMRF